MHSEIPYNPKGYEDRDLNNTSESSLVTAQDINHTTIFPNTTEVPITEPLCQWILYHEISNSRVRIWDLIILIPNAVFLLFLIYKAPKAVVKLRNTNSPIFSAFYALVSLVAIISVLRCVVSMTVNAAVLAGDIADKVLWLILRFFLLATELSVVVFGLMFGHLDSHTSIKRVLAITFTISLIYSTVQGILEFLHPDERFHVKNDNEEFDMFGHGGMLFWFASSIFFTVIYTAICILPFTSLKNRFALPTKKSFYFYCGLLAVLNAAQAVGSGMLHYYVEAGLCIVNTTTYLYFTGFAPLVYGTFLRDFFRTTPAPPNILFSYKSQVDEMDDDQVHLPHQTYIPTKPPGYPEDDQGASSYDSTHFDARFSPNPLYDVDMPYTGMQAELSVNSDYYTVPASGQGQEMQNPVA